LFSEGVAKFNQLFLFTHWAVAIDLVAMPFSSAHQVWVGIAGINRSSEERYQSSALIE
jgi:hypothetical protein